YLTLKRMAHNYLAIQGSATPSECAFSSGGITDTSQRNRLQPDIFEGLQLLKSAYRNGHILCNATGVSPTWTVEERSRLSEISLVKSHDLVVRYTVLIGARDLSVHQGKSHH
ncbi:hypothetical protein EDB92DRAFT_1789439, partial [Lactarius akahatsu]